MIPWLTEPDAFPPLDKALREPNGLLAAGGALSPEWLLAAYSRGSFPWFDSKDPILWWSPDPRLVLRPGEVRIRRSLAKRLRRGDFEVRFDTDFGAVIRACAAPREPGGGTWIHPEMQTAYLRLHELGYAHSVETYQDEKLVGGLYGIALGRIFFGESMFSRVSDASKVALVHLARHLEKLGFAVIDCQMTTAHLSFMGAEEIPRAQFAEMLARWGRQDMAPECWPADAARNMNWL
ncbi:leucyl/phenylalanyl-tRNA--protein transferase [Cognatazoarcus halotolerans]|uniref:leucyl/phenylalanyl-tRNA--protein transferase n=1 Tax=Cognatazoarcus halotolerans TaxID=2686016 RepID=UPI00135BDEB7|nr:leucyl/phenylalanyl-tRNA--protein transferase [Cognatazoarcus halotolerans]MCB1900669.1 leucyl/phenylalanyl-tRNA--protein transferase [Rhodocyclaceae bacterium]MCP5309472.1 leucyl/phenylalanyl-tRNA--protein transferase [Zoogloeaceae bacterium]